MFKVQICFGLVMPRTHLSHNKAACTDGRTCYATKTYSGSRSMEQTVSCHIACVVACFIVGCD